VPASPDSAAPASVGLNAVIISVDGTTPRLLTVEHSPGAPGCTCEGLPLCYLGPGPDRTLEKVVRRLVGDDIGLPVRYFEQLYTFGDLERVAGQRELAVAYLALARHQANTGSVKAQWRDVYELFPWEDWRAGRPGVIDELILPALHGWLARSSPGQRGTRTERAELTFGHGQALWDPVRALDRYELLYELQLVPEATPPPLAGTAFNRALGVPLALDHRRIAAAALERLRGKLAYRPVVFEVLPQSFTLSRLQQVVEAFAGQVLHKQNFRRLVASANLVEPTGEVDQRTGGRPAELYRFRRDVLRERPAPGLGLRRLGGP
jgi:hypothetical protein